MSLFRRSLSSRIVRRTRKIVRNKQVQRSAVQVAVRVIVAGIAWLTRRRIMKREDEVAEATAPATRRWSWRSQRQPATAPN